MLHLDINTVLSEPISVAEVRNAICLPSTGRFTGTDAILALIYKTTGACFVEKFNARIHATRSCEVIHQNLCIYTVRE